MGLINKDNENSFEKASEQYEEDKVSSKIKSKYNEISMWQSFLDTILDTQGDDIYSYSQDELTHNESKYSSYLDPWIAIK